MLPFGAATTHGFTTPVGDLTAVTDAITAFADALAFKLITGIQIPSVTWKVGPEATGPSVEIAVNAVGSESGSPATPNTAYLVNLPVVGMSGRFGGKFFLPGVAEGSVNGDGGLVGAFQTSLQSAVVDAYNAMATVSSQPFVFPANGGDPHEVDAVLVNTRAATQRRRMRR